MNNIKIERANSYDALDIMEIRHKGWISGYKEDLGEELINQKFEKENNDPARLSSLKTYLDSNNHNCYVAKLDNKAVGLFWFEDADRKNSDTCFLYGFYVLPDYQRQGIGTQLWNWGIEKLQENGYTKLTLTTTQNNKKAKQFYFSHKGKIDKKIEEEMIDNKKTMMDEFSFDL